MIESFLGQSRLTRGVYCIISTLIFAVAATAQAQVNKCVGTDGKTSYSDRECPAVKAPPAKAISEGEGLACAINWLLNRTPYEQTFGVMVERIIVGGQESYRRTPEARTAVKQINPWIENCAAVGIVRPTRREDLASNMWNAMERFCQPLNQATAKQASPLIRKFGEENIPISNLNDEAMIGNQSKECTQIRKTFPTLEAVRADYRAKFAESNKKPPTAEELRRMEVEASRKRSEEIAKRMQEPAPTAAGGVGGVVNCSQIGPNRGCR